MYRFNLFSHPVCEKQQQQKSALTKAFSAVYRHVRTLLCDVTRKKLGELALNEAENQHRCAFLVMMITGAVNKI
jgi:hypothetical protein